VFVASVADETEVKEIATQVGSWDVLALGAAHLSAPSTIVKAPLQDWWADYETNVKSAIIAAQAFIPNAKPGAAIHGATAGSLVLPPNHAPFISRYLSSKVAQAKVPEFLAAENPNILITAVHPGLCRHRYLQEFGCRFHAAANGFGYVTAPCGLRKAALTPVLVWLPANFLVWLSQSKAVFLYGKTVWANWDVEELVPRAKEIGSSQILTIGCEGGPFTPRVE